MRCPVLPPNADLHGQARGFAQLLNNLPNGTITNGVRMRAVVVSTGQVSVGHAPTKSMVVNRQPFPLAVANRSPACFMGLSYTMTLDPEGQYLTVATSVCALYADAEGSDELLHYDYERNKHGGYPEAHLQVHAESTSLGAVMAKRGLDHHMHKLHFPVGGRRYRPSLEDVIEFLIVERLVDARTTNCPTTRSRPAWPVPVLEGVPPLISTRTRQLLVSLPPPLKGAGAADRMRTRRSAGGGYRSVSSTW
jgi:hypothetical protein